MYPMTKRISKTKNTIPTVAPIDIDLGAGAGSGLELAIIV